MPDTLCAAAFEADGFLFLPAVLSAQHLMDADRALEHFELHAAGARDVLSLAPYQNVARQLQSHEVLKTLLPASAVAVQCTLFDKTEERNWLVPVHQDLSVPVAAQVDHPALKGWSRKDNRYFVQPPDELLARMVAVRVHLDECGADNGPLRVVRGSHSRGRMSDAAAQAMRDRDGEVECLALRGDAFAMRPLLLHASSKAKRPQRRRVLHFLFGPREPGYGLRWAATI